MMTSRGAPGAATDDSIVIVIRCTSYRRAASFVRLSMSMSMSKLKTRLFTGWAKKGSVTQTTLGGLTIYPAVANFL